MNCNQTVIRPDLNPPVNRDRGGDSRIGKLRRKLGLTFILSNPFKVPVAQLPATPETLSPKADKKSI